MPVAGGREHRFHPRPSEREERTLADQKEFALSGERWRALNDALDRPVRRLPELEKLLREPSVLERA
jgi:uncharacterized protein (DUF1778 family)